MLDLNGEPALGKRLSGLLYRTQSEEFEIDISKRESEKRRLERESAALAADKVLRRMRVDIMTDSWSRTRNSTSRFDPQ